MPCPSFVAAICAVVNVAAVAIPQRSSVVL
jgi:hypothetical protein